MAQRTGHIEQLTEAYGIDASFIAVAHDLLTVFYACLHSTEILNISPPQSRNIQSTEITMDIDDVARLQSLFGDSLPLVQTYEDHETLSRMPGPLRLALCLCSG